LLLYIHIPFCDSKCHYCAFNSYVDKFDRRKRYMQALVHQWKHELTRAAPARKSIKTLFVGGGTPSTVAPEMYAPLFEAVRPYLADDAEITFEANPNSASRRWLEGIRTLGATRVSFGVQSFDENKLKRLGRAHSPAQAREALLCAAEAGFAHLSLDLIYNVAGDTSEAMERDIKTALALPIDHLSAYELTIEEHTPFADMPQMRREDDDLAFRVAEMLTAHGFAHYEISNFGRYRCRHNLGYWELQPYIGLGAGAVGFLHTPSFYRYYPHSDIDAYIADPAYAAVERLDEEALRLERLFLGWRSIIGVAQDVLTPAMRQRADILVNEGKLYTQHARYYNPNFFLADETVLYVAGN